LDALMKLQEKVGREPLIRQLKNDSGPKHYGTMELEIGPDPKGFSEKGTAPQPLNQD
jgi:hypothetical protein